jgi:hypothetical protein
MTKQSMHGVAEASPLVMAWDHVEHPMPPGGLMLFMYRNARFGTQTMVEPHWIDMARELRFLLIGYSPAHIGGPPMIVAGRAIEASHYELVADTKTGLKPGEVIRLRGFDYTVVGLTRNMVWVQRRPRDLRQTRGCAKYPLPAGSGSTPQHSKANRVPGGRRGGGGSEAASTVTAHGFGDIGEPSHDQRHCGEGRARSSHCGSGGSDQTLETSRSVYIRAASQHATDGR